MSTEDDGIAGRHIGQVVNENGSLGAQVGAERFLLRGRSSKGLPQGGSGGAAGRVGPATGAGSGGKAK